jgi:hypothetical protein
LASVRSSSLTWQLTENGRSVGSATRQPLDIGNNEEDCQSEGQVVPAGHGRLRLILFFLTVPPHFAGNRTARRLSIAGSTVGVISGIGFIGIAAVPSDVNLTLHTNFVFVAFTGFLLVVFCYSAAILKSRAYPRTYAYAYLAFAVVLALYLVLLFSGPEVETTGGLTIQAVGQKIVVYTGIICVVIQSYGAYRVEQRRLSQV